MTNLIKVMEGRKNLSELLDDVFLTLKDSGGEVLISGVDERKFLEADKKSIIGHIARLMKHGIKEKLLVKEGDLFFLAGEQSVYKWMPENAFSPTPVYIYGNKVAIILWTSREIIIIENPTLADNYRKQFIFLWENAKVPPIKSPQEDERKRLENAIMKRFGGRISPITDKDKKLFHDMLEKEKTFTYGNSFYYICQAANGTGDQKLGLKFFDGELLAGIGIFDRSSLGGGWHFHVIRPIGKFTADKILSLAKAMLELSGNPVFVKKLTDEQKSKLIGAGFTSIENYPWHAQSVEEDDTFPEQIINIENILVDSNNTKTNIGDKYNRFYSKFGKELQVADLSEINYKDALEIVKNFFEYLEIKNVHISQPSDYDNIIFHPPLGKNGKTFFSQIIYIAGKPAAFFAAEPLSPDTVGLYANITLHQEYSYLSEYLIVYICKMLKAKGYKHVNLGGSETGGLFQFKDKLHPDKYNKMSWVVYKFN
ncbi:MAG: hypothetical protein HY513_04950 [Candidatus Aenigmarchaeota archaeon]|nr:hypothetical protein [Candidatus Aenigmarchaeota archaeon]